MLATVTLLSNAESLRRCHPAPPAGRRKRESIAAYRRRITRTIAKNGPRAWHLMAQIRTAKTGPDPESALVYVQQLRDSLDEMLRLTLPR